MNGLCIRALTRLVLGASCPVCWQSMNAAVIRSEAMAATWRGEIMCGGQSWVRRPGDGADLGWILWN